LTTREHSTPCPNSIRSTTRNRATRGHPLTALLRCVWRRLCRNRNVHPPHSSMTFCARSQRTFLPSPAAQTERSHTGLPALRPHPIINSEQGGWTSHCAPWSPRCRRCHARGRRNPRKHAPEPRRPLWWGRRRWEPSSEKILSP